MHYIYKCLVVIFLIPTTTYTQNLSDFENVEEITREGFFKTYFTGLFKGFTDIGSPFGMNGGVGLNMRSYSPFGDEPRQDPFFYTINANANVQVYKLNIPFSLLVTARNTTASYPHPGQFVDAFKDNVAAQKDRFVRVGMSPQYKWITAHLGHRNMTFSQFTLSNLTFFGAGVELNPGKLRFAAFSGRLANAEPVDLSLNEPNLPVFERRGWGVKLGYGTQDDFIDVSLFKGWDDSLSISAVTPQEVFPNENLVVGVTGQKIILDKVQLSLDYASSALTSNTGDQTRGGNQFPHPSFLIEALESTNYSNALDTKADYLGEGFTVGLGYKRIDPGYRSLGAYFFDNDIENFTANTNLGLFEQQVQLSASAGLQRDNLDDSKPATLNRFIGSASLNYTKDNFNAGLNYSNFSSDIQYVLDPELDSLNVVVVTQELGATLSYTKANQQDNRHTVSLTGNYQAVTDDIDNPTESSESNMVNLTLVYAYLLTESKWKFNTTCNYHQNELPMMQVNRWGVGGGVGKTLLEDKLNLGLNINYFKATVESLADITNNTLNLRFQCDYRITQNHSLNINYTLLNQSKLGNMSNTGSFTEGIGNLGYRYNFSIQPGKGGQ